MPVSRSATTIAGAAGRDVPGLLGVDRRRRGAGDGAGAGRAGRLQVPLADRRPAGARRDRARRVERIVGRRDDVFLLVGNRVFDIAFGADPGRELARRHAAGEDHLRSLRHRPARRQGDADALAERLRLHRVLAERRLGLHAQHRRAGAELDDHPCRQRRRARPRHLRQRRVQRERRQQGRGDDAGADQDTSHHSLLQRAAALTTPSVRRTRRAGLPASARRSSSQFRARRHGARRPLPRLTERAGFVAKYRTTGERAPAPPRRAATPGGVAATASTVLAQKGDRRSG